MPLNRSWRALAFAAALLILSGCTTLSLEPQKPTEATRWNQALLDAVKATRSSDVVTARALGAMNTAIYDAWAMYDGMAMPVHLDPKLRRAHRPNEAEQRTALSFAAYRVLIDLFPSRSARLSSRR